MQYATGKVIFSCHQTNQEGKGGKRGGGEGGIVEKRDEFHETSAVKKLV